MNIYLTAYLKALDDNKNDLNKLNAIIESASMSDDITNKEYEMIYNHALNIIK